MWHITFLLALQALGNGDGAPLRQAAPQDSLWRRYLVFLSDQGGVWLASNQQYRTPQNREPEAFLMRYWEGFGGTNLHGCMWGETSGEEPMMLWQFFTAWDPVRKALLIHQAAANGVIGVGHESPRTGIADLTFVGPDGTRRELRQQGYSSGPDTLVTQTFRPADKGWQLERTYVWLRQESAPVDAPCGEPG